MTPPRPAGRPRSRPPVHNQFCPTHSKFNALPRSDNDSCWPLLERGCASARSLRKPISQAGKQRLRLWSLHEARGAPIPTPPCWPAPRFSASLRCLLQTVFCANGPSRVLDPNRPPPGRPLIRTPPGSFACRKARSSAAPDDLRRVANLASVASHAAVGKPKRRAEVRGNSRSCRISPTAPELRFPATSSGSRAVGGQPARLTPDPSRRTWQVVSRVRCEV